MIFIEVLVSFARFCKRFHDDRCSTMVYQSPTQTYFDQKDIVGRDLKDSATSLGEHVLTFHLCEAIEKIGETDGNSAVQVFVFVVII